MKTLNFQNLVVGGGYFSQSTTVLLSQLNGTTHVLETSSSVYSIASLRNQRMLNSGVTWFFDRAGEEVLSDFYTNFELTAQLLNQPVEDNTIDSYMTLSNKQLEKLERANDNMLMHDYDIIDRNTGCPLINHCLTSYNPMLRLVKIPDRPFDIAGLMNGFRFYTEKYYPGKVTYQMVQRSDSIDLQHSNGTVRVVVNDTIIEAEKIFLCTGTGTFNILSKLVGPDVDTLTYTDPSIDPTFESDFTFQTDVLPMYHLKYNDMYPDLLVNIHKCDAFVRQGLGANYVSSNIKECVPIIGDYTISDTKRKDLYEALSSELLKYPFLKTDIVGNWHCKRIERKFKRGSFCPTSVSSWVTKCTDFDNVFFGLPGKASLSLTASRNLIKLAGYDISQIEHKVEYGGTPHYKHIND